MIRLKFYALALLSVLAALLGVYRYGQKMGERAVEVKQQRKINQVRKVSQDVKTDHTAMPINNVRDGLRKHWTRD